MLAALLLLAGCQSLPAERQGAEEVGAVHPTLALAQGACGGCHAVERFDLSPNPQAPPFIAIANRDGLNASTLAGWLRDAHNYPEDMEFTLDPPQVERLVEYIVTLQDPNYQPTVG